MATFQEIDHDRICQILDTYAAIGAANQWNCENVCEGGLSEPLWVYNVELSNGMVWGPMMHDEILAFCIGARMIMIVEWEEM